jgi:hypothetical protein
MLANAVTDQAIVLWISMQLELELPLQLAREIQGVQGFMHQGDSRRG